jgi:hypothetical protein
VNPLGPRARIALLGGVLVAQTLFFAVLLPRPLEVVADNARYETAGFNVATGRGLSLPLSILGDSDVRAWACSRRPDWCPGDLYPTASYPPGYQYFIAAVYLISGRSLGALVGTQLAFLLGMFVLFERTSFKLLPRAGHVFVMGVSATYPFLARQAGLVMSDHVHAVLLLAAVWAAVCLAPGAARGVAVGLLLAAATLVRPYSLLLAPFLLLLRAARRGLAMKPREAIIAGAAFCLPFGLWTTRNALVFGRFIPLSTSGIGVSLYLNKLEWTIGSPLDGENSKLMSQEMQQVAGADILSVAGNRALRRQAIAWMVNHPWSVALGLPARLVRVWVSIGYEGAGASVLAPLSVLYLGGLWCLGVIGLWRRAGDGAWSSIAVIVVVYWLVLMHAPAEARRTLPVRLPLLLFAGAAVADAAGWHRTWRTRVASSISSIPPASR